MIQPVGLRTNTKSSLKPVQVPHFAGKSNWTVGKLGWTVGKIDWTVNDNKFNWTIGKADCFEKQ